MWVIPGFSCRFCGKARRSGSPLCAACLMEFDQATLGRPPVRPSRDGCPIVSSFWYEGFPRTLFLQAKFQGDRAIADFLIGKAFSRLGDPGGIGLWLPIPPDPGRLLQRGICLQDRMAYRFSRLTGIPWSSEGGRPRPGRQSKFLDKEERSFRNDERWEPVSGSTRAPVRGVCLLDDLVTTGGTLFSFGRFRKAQGDQVVMAATLFDSRLRRNGE